MTHPVRTFLWFNGRGREAAEFYCTLIPGSKVEAGYSGESGGGDGGTFEVIDFSLGGVPYEILDAGPMFPLSECVSVMIRTPDQAETDRLWDALVEGGGSHGPCGWLKDRFGLSWQIVPEAAFRLMTDPDPKVTHRALQAVYKMSKIDIAAIEAAAREDA